MARTGWVHENNFEPKAVSAIHLVGWLVVLGLTDSISVFIRPSPKEREKEER